MTVIADDAQVHDIGGIMGGEDSGVSEATTDVMLEVAYFTPGRIARTGQALALTSDARSRFERGVDPEFLDKGLAILTGLIVDICGGEPSAVIRAGEPPVERKTVEFDYGRTLALGGIDVPEARQHEILRSLGFEVKGNAVTAPSWRRDVEGSADLVEEVTRIVGDQVPSTPLDRAPGGKTDRHAFAIVERRVR
jgi:phenylalanyl-tRNA synthetase beta chain